jgi:type VI secretion system secreted protein Hcp
MSKKLRAVLCAVVPAVVLALAVPVAAPAAPNAFLKSDALTGESVQVDHAGEIELGDWSWRASRAGGRVTVDELALSKSVDTSSTQLFTYLTSGAAIPSAKLLVVKSTGAARPEVYYRLCMTGVRVTSIATRGGEDGSVSEDVTLSFATLVESYRRQNNDGSLAPAVFAGWDLINRLQYGDPTC